MTVTNKSLEQYKTQIASNLKYLLDNYSMNILELSSKLELSYPPLYNLVTGRSNPTMDTLLKIANYFNLSISQLIGDIPINKIDSTNYSKIIPLLQWTNAAKFLCERNSTQHDFKQLLISSEYFIPEKTFSLYANERTEPLFKTGTLLIFNEITSDIKHYDNKYVLLLSDMFLTIKKLFYRREYYFYTVHKHQHSTSTIVR
jgi:transcriptional regulator with XRE-family HTH domain